MTIEKDLKAMTARSPFLESIITLFAATLDEDRGEGLDRVIEVAMREAANNTLSIAHRYVIDHVVNTKEIRVDPDLLQQVTNFIFWAVNELCEDHERGKQTGQMLMGRLNSARQATEAARRYAREKGEKNGIG